MFMKNATTTTDDPTYIIQGLYSDGTIAEQDGAETLALAKAAAFRMLRSPCFEGSCVRIITRDGELVTNRAVSSA